MQHELIRVRRESRRRRIAVANVERLTPKMLRVTFQSPELSDFDSASFDDHIKFFFPGDARSGEAGEPKAIMRDFTPRAFDRGAARLVVDFALHDNGPATQWASQASVGQKVEIGGPRGSTVIPDDFDWHLLVGDETALPAIGRRMEELRADVPATTVVVVDGQDEAQTFQTKADWRARWVARPSGARDDILSLRGALADVELPSGDGFVWIAAEASVARSLRDYIVNDRGHPRQWVKAAGYWKSGETAAHVKIED